MLGVLLLLAIPQTPDSKVTITFRYDSNEHAHESLEQSFAEEFFLKAGERDERKVLRVRTVTGWKVDDQSVPLPDSIVPIKIEEIWRKEAPPKFPEAPDTAQATIDRLLAIPYFDPSGLKAMTWTDRIPNGGVVTWNWKTPLKVTLAKKECVLFEANILLEGRLLGTNKVWLLESNGIPVKQVATSPSLGAPGGDSTLYAFRFEMNPVP